MHWQQGGEMLVEKSCISSLQPILVVKGELVHFFSFLGFGGELLPNLSGPTGLKSGLTGLVEPA
jgi:hypothetical protein